MKKAILGRKLGMSQIFTAEGIVIPVTIVEAGPCPIVQVKFPEKDGYSAIQVAFGEKRENIINKPIKGHFKKAEVSPKRFLREFRTKDGEAFEVGQVINCDAFVEGDKVDVTGKTRGRGFTGTVQRWNTSIGPMSHGSGYHRGPGAMSGCASPGRVFKNRKLPGHYGDEQVTVQNLEVVRVDKTRNLLFIKGGVPGANNSLLIVKQTLKV